MRLVDAASYFDRTPVYEADGSTPLFKGQLDDYDDSKRDSGAAYRRILSVRPGTAMPATRAVRMFDLTWLVGAKETDGLDQAHRDKYVLQRAGVKLTVNRLPDFVSGAVGQTKWADPEWLKDSHELATSSKVPQIFSVFLPLGTDVRVYDVLWYAGAAFLTMAVRDLPSGFRAAECLELDQTVPAIASITRRTYDPVAGSFTSAASVDTPCLRVRWQSLYLYSSQSDTKYQEGDTSLVVGPSVPVSTADNVLFDGVTWQVLDVDSLGGANVIHARLL